MITLKRAYEPASKDDGLRILVERLWPRGVSKQKAKIDFWLKDLAPSTELRQWYGHDPARWPQFRKRYWAELKGQGDLLALLKYVIKEKVVTFVYAASNEERNSAVALKELLERRKTVPDGHYHVALNASGNHWHSAHPEDRRMPRPAGHVSDRHLFVPRNLPSHGLYDSALRAYHHPFADS
jgi:uncharacterized protein YeaO (DUF488 family)